jgi:hypothetical protein
VLRVACMRCPTVMPDLAQVARLAVRPHDDVPPPTITSVPADSAAVLPDGLMADLVETNGGQPVTRPSAGWC